MSERLYSLLLLLYPRVFREQYGEEMARVFRDRLREEPVVSLWVEVLGDAVVSIPQQYLTPRPHPYYPRSATPLLLATPVVTQGILSTVALGGLVGFLVGVLVVRGVPGISAFISRVPGGWVVPAVLSVLWLITARRWWRISRNIKSVRADVSADSVTVAYDGVAPLTLQRNDVIGLHDFDKIGLRIQAADPSRDLWVPARTKAYADVKAGLSHWGPTTVTPLRFASGLSIGVTTVFLVVGLLIPVKLVPAVIGLVISSQAVAAVVKPDVPIFKRLVPFVAILVLLIRWLR